MKRINLSSISIGPDGQRELTESELIAIECTAEITAGGNANCGGTNGVCGANQNCGGSVNNVCGNKSCGGTTDSRCRQLEDEEIVWE